MMVLKSSRVSIGLIVASLLVFLFLFSTRSSEAAPEDTPLPVVLSPLDKWTMEDTFAYWADQCEIIPLADNTQSPSADSILRRKPLAGGAVKDMDTSSNCFMYNAMTADGTGVYYTDNINPGTIFRFGKGANAQPVPVASNVGQLVQKIVLDNTYLYYTDTSDKIYRVPKAGGSPQVIIDADKIIGDFYVDSSAIYWMEVGGNLGWAPNKNCGTPPCDHTVFLGPNGRHIRPGPPALAGDPPFIYYVENASQELRMLQCKTENGLCQLTPLHDTPDGWTNLGIINVCIPGIFTGCLSGDNYVFIIERKNSGVGSRVVRVKLSGGSDEIAIGDYMLDGIYVHEGFVYFAEASTGAPGIYRLPYNAAPIIHELKAAGMEVTNAIQSLNNDVPVIGAKPTYVRLFAQQTSGPRAMSVDAWLYGEKNGQPLPGSPLRPLNGPLELVSSAPVDRGDEDGGWLFKLPFGWTLTDQLHLEGVIDPRQNYAETDRADNHLVKTVPVASESDACLFMSPVRTHTPLPHYTDPNFWPTMQRYVSMWPMPDATIYWWGEPIEELETCWWGPVPYPCYRPYELDQGWDWDNWFPDQDRVIAKLIARQALARVESPFLCQVGSSVHSVGMVHPDADTTNSQGTTYGLANLFFNASWTKFPPHNDTPTFKRWNWPDAGSTMAQEITHNFWRKHVDCGNPSGVDDNFPYADPCKLDDGALDAPGTHFGFDTISQKVISPNEAADYMSYAKDTWVSDYTYKGVKDDIGLFLDSSGAQELAQAAKVVLATGFYEPDMNLGRINTAYVMDSAAISLENLSAMAAPRWQDVLYRQPATDDEPLPGHLLLKNAQGAILDDRALDIIPNDDHSFPVESFFFAASFPAPAQPVALMQLVVNGAVVGELEMGSKLPQVQVTGPGAGAVVDQSFVVNWQGSDPDGDILLYNIYYSPNEGTDWFPLANDYPGTFGSSQGTLQLDQPEAVPGSHGQHALIRVTASDGFNSATAVSNLFTVVDKTPLAFISQPAPQETFDAGETIPLQGAGLDPEDGSLDSKSFAWSVQTAKYLNNVDQELIGLQPGTHQLKLAVQDADGNKAQATADLTVLPLQIPYAENGPNLDGRCSDAIYAGAKTLRLSPYSAGGGQPGVDLLRTDDTLWACFSGLEFGAAGQPALAALLVDEDYSRETNAQSIDTYYGVRADGSLEVAEKKAIGGNWNSINLPDGFAAKVSAETENSWQAEIQIPATLISGWGAEIGLGLWSAAEQEHTNAIGDAVWPSIPTKSIAGEPGLWAHTLLAAAPVLDELQPNTGIIGGEELILNLTGRNFGPDAQVLWQGESISATRKSDTEMVAALSNSELAATGLFAVTVVNQSLPDFPSNARQVTLQNPQPVINSLDPNQVDAGAQGFKLVIKGQNFINGAVVSWDGLDKATTFISDKEVRADISAADLALGGNVAVSVRNPDPAAGPSSAAFFRVEPNPDAFPSQPLYMPVVLGN